MSIESIKRDGNHLDVRVDARNPYRACGIDGIEVTYESGVLKDEHGVSAQHYGDMLAYFARTPKENPMTDTIDPTTCKPGEYYLVETAGREFLGERVDPEDYLQWRLNRPASVWVRDVDVTVLHRLVPEVDDVVDAEVEEDWTILRKAADAILHSGYDPTTLTTMLDVADYLTGQAGRIEAEYHAAQEKAAADVAREALIVKAARIQCDAIHGPGAFDDREPDDHVRDRYVDSTRALADAGYLAEAVQP